MQRLYTLLFSALFLLSFSHAQNDDSFESRFDRTTDNIERMVDNIINRLESEIEQWEDSPDYHVEYFTDDDRDQDKDRSNVSPDAVTFNGNTEIAEGDTIHGDLVVKNGMLVVRGVVAGDVLVVNGDIELKSSSRILGNVRAMNGSIAKDEGAYVEGYSEQSTSVSTPRSQRRKSTYRTKYSYSFKPYYWNTENIVDDNFLFRYNRVEGFFFGFGEEKNFYWDGSKAISGFGSFGYGFASHRWRLQLGLDRQFAVGDGVLYEFGGEVHSLTDTKDEWIMNLAENSLAALLFREDFRDYFQREGYSVHAARYGKEGDLSTMIDVRYVNDRYASLTNGANWAVFGGTTFRGNPAINAGTMKSLSFSTGLSTVEKYRYHSEGWNLYLRAEYGGNELGGDFDFTQAVVDIRRFQPITDNDQINLRIRAGALEGAAITQRLFELGGANTLPAYGFKEFAGNRMLLANLEYRIGDEILDEIFFWPGSFSLIAFGDIGAATFVNRNSPVYEEFDAIPASAVKSDYGAAIAWYDGDARLGFAWRTDKQAPVSIFFRLNRAF